MHIHPLFVGGAAYDIAIVKVDHPFLIRRPVQIIPMAKHVLRGSFPRKYLQSIFSILAQKILIPGFCITMLFGLTLALFYVCEF